MRAPVSTGVVHDIGARMSATGASIHYGGNGRPVLRWTKLLSCREVVIVANESQISLRSHS